MVFLVVGMLVTAVALFCLFFIFAAWCTILDEFLYWSEGWIIAWSVVLTGAFVAGSYFVGRLVIPS